MPLDVEVTGLTDTSCTVAWNVVVDEFGGSGMATYVVAVDGVDRVTFPQSTALTIYSGSTSVPVGLFGLAIKTSLVAGVIASAIASKSWVNPGSGTSTVFAPKSVAMSL